MKKIILASAIAASAILTATPALAGSGNQSTATGSAKLVDKRSITRHDQAIVVGIKPERDGAVVLPLEGNEDLCPSIEAMEMMGICKAAGTHSRLNSRGETVEVSNVRCILHGHLGIADYDPAFVESVRLDAPYYQQLVSCGTDALANGTCAAFSRSAQTTVLPSGINSNGFLRIWSKVRLSI